MKLVIYQVFTRTFGNKNTNNQPNGTIADNGVGKMSDFNKTTLQQIKSSVQTLFGTLALYATPPAPTILHLEYHAKLHVL